MDHNLDKVAKAVARENGLSYALVGLFDDDGTAQAGFGASKAMDVQDTRTAAATMVAAARALVRMIAEETGRDAQEIALEVGQLAIAPDREEIIRRFAEHKEPDDG